MDSSTEAIKQYMKMLRCTHKKSFDAYRFAREMKNQCGHIRFDLDPSLWVKMIVNKFAELKIKKKPHDDGAKEFWLMCCTCFTILFSKCVNEPCSYIMENDFILFHPQMTKRLCQLYWNYTDLWFRVEEKRKYFKIANVIRSADDLTVQTVNMMQLVNIVVSIEWLKPYHWRHIVLEQGFLDHAIIMIKNDVWCMCGYSEGGNANFGLFLIEYIASDLSRRKYGSRYVRYCKNKLKDVSLMLEFKRCKSNECIEEFRENAGKIQRKGWSALYSNEKCMRIECKNKRGKKDHKRKFRMCKKCKIASYCSRTCAKLDWNHGYHRIYCNDYAE